MIVGQEGCWLAGLSFWKVEPNFLFEWELQKWLAGAMACFFQGQGV
jgi:hypothetical protein